MIKIVFRCVENNSKNFIPPNIDIYNLLKYNEENAYQRAMSVKRKIREKQILKY